MAPSRDPRRSLPPVHVLLAHPGLAEARRRRGHEPVAQAARVELGLLRKAIEAGQSLDVSIESLAGHVLTRLAASRPHLRPVINATGILLHTGLGRAPLAAQAIAAVAETASGYCNLEMDLESGERGRRVAGVEELLRRLTGAEAATVVNNNAAATVLALSALAAGREVVVSRGQLVEIGGSFRLPEIFAASGARLREVGTTNKTRLADYATAIGPETAALLRVHASNFQIVGFTESVPIADLARLGRERGVWTIDDIGSGSLGPGRPPGLVGEPSVAEGLAAGADLILASGDKLLGGPQCGLMVGSKAAVDLIASAPLMRAFRVDKLTLAALEATLRLALDHEPAALRIPLWAFLSLPRQRLRERSEALVASLCSRISGLDAAAVDTQAYLGGGSLPGEALPSAGVRLTPPYPGPCPSEEQLARSLRRGDPAVVARVQAGALWLDLRAVAEGEDDRLLLALLTALGRARPAPGELGD